MASVLISLTAATNHATSALALILKNARPVPLITTSSFSLASQEPAFLIVQTSIPITSLKMVPVFSVKKT